MIKFKAKNFSILSDTLAGSTIGGSLGATIGGIMFNRGGNNQYSKETRTVATNRKGEVILDKDSKVQYNTVTEKGDNTKIKFPWFRKGEDGKLSRSDLNVSPLHGTLLSTTAGMVFGAALGALVGTGKAIGKKINQKRTVDSRILEDVVRNLKPYKEGKDFTRDPKVASDLKTRICIVLSKISGEQQILINLASDKKLEELAEKAINLLPQSNTKVNKTISDKYNDIIINSIPDKTMPRVIANMAEIFIKAHYPVYLIEVG